jgi:hypothetical protein
MDHNEAEDFLAHYGKKGMRWGQRMRARDAAIKEARVKSSKVSSNFEAARLNARLQEKLSSNPNSRDNILAKARLDKAANAYVSDKNTAMASKLTTGESVVASMAVALGAISYAVLTKASK